MAVSEVGYFHHPDGAGNGVGVVLSHGAGSNADAPLLVSLAVSLAQAGYVAYRLNLPFRRSRPSGPPSPAGSASDRQGILEAAATLRTMGLGRVLLAGHSYGGRQSSMLAAENPSAADGLILLSYPLHPPRKPEQLRTAHFADLRTPALFFHGDRDAFGSIAEMRAALELIPGKVKLVEVRGAGHDLKRRDIPSLVLAELAGWPED